jgi:hypothetical protein
MKRSAISRSIVLLVILSASAIALTSSQALAQAGGGYDLTWNTVDGGGGMFSTGGGFSLGGTIGQPDAGAAVAGGGGYALTGGFWYSGAAQFSIFLPLVLKNL